MRHVERFVTVSLLALVGPWLAAQASIARPARNTQVRAGGAALVANGTAPVHAHTDWRYEYHYPGVTEAYDVRSYGVEQTFTIERRPARPGDLVVTGSIVTEQLAATS